MLAPSLKLQLACVAAMAAVGSVDAHGYMSAPKVEFAIQGDPTQYCATMDGPKTLTAPAGMSFTTDPLSNTKAFNAAFKASQYKSIKALVEAKATFKPGMSRECGVTSATAAKQPLPPMVEWSHSASEGFTPSHEGPCEVWCDNKIVFTDDNCSRNYPMIPAKLPYKKDQCAGAKMLKIYWLALHSSEWQVYLNCGPLTGGGSGGGGGGGSKTPKVTPKAPVKNATPKATTKAPARKSTPSKTSRPARPSNPEVGGEADDEDCEDELDVAGDAPATKAPKGAKAPKPAKTKKSKARSGEYSFDELEN